jgi:hypothetical protein
VLYLILLQGPTGSLFALKARGIITSGLYHKHVMIVNYASSDVNKLKASLNDDARVIFYDRHMFIVQETGPEAGLLKKSLSLAEPLWLTYM